MTLVLRYAARSDVGLIRTNNEDALYAGPRLLAVADTTCAGPDGEGVAAVIDAVLDLDSLS